MSSTQSNRPWNRRRFLGALGLGAAGLGAAGLGAAGLGAAGAVVSCRAKTPDAGPVTVWLIWPMEPGTPPTHLIQRLQLQYPGLALDVSSIWTNNLREKLFDAALNRALPDVLTLNSAWVPELEETGALTNIAPFAQADGLNLAQILLPDDLARSRTPNGLFSLPAVSSSGTAMLFSNQPLLKKHGLPTNVRFRRWDDFVVACRDYVAHANPGNTIDYAALDPFSGPGLVLHTALSFGFGQPTVSEDGRRSLLDSPGSLQVARELDRFVDEVYGLYGGYRALLHFRFRFSGQHRQPSYYSAPYPRMLFSIAAAGTASVLRSQGVPLEQIGTQPVPGLRGPHGGVRSHWWSYAIHRHSPRHAAAWQVVRFLALEREGGGRFCLDFGRPSPLQAISDADYRAAIGPAWDGIKEAIALDRPYPASPAEDFLRPLIFAVPMRRLQGESIEQIFRDLHARYQAYLDGTTRHAA